MTIPIKIISKKEFGENPNQEEVWDEVSELWLGFRVKPIPIVEEFLMKVSSEFENSEKCKIIDLGSGSGRNMIKNEGAEYYEVDFSGKQLEAGKRKAEQEKINAKFFKIKADRLPFEDEFFDSGLFIAALHCIEDEAERLSSLKEFYRVLKKDVEAMISVWDAEDGRFSEKGKEVYMEWKVNDVPYMRYYYLYNKKEIIDLLEKVGFEILEVYEPREKDRFSRKNLILRIKK